MNPPETKNFSVLIGGKTPEERENASQVPAANLIEAEKQLLIHANNQEFLFKWNNCSARSDKTEYEVRACCGGVTKKTGFRCFLLSILDLNPEICSRCNSFRAKEAKPENQ